MPASIVVGLQWGDEGKGKTTDFLAEQTAMVVRYQGGDNAGHTLVLGDEVFKLHLVPSGVLYPHITTVIGPGVVVNPATLIEEIDALADRGIDCQRLRVSRSAHVILPYHRALDAAREARLAGAKVGTTGRGIGPAYEDRAARSGIRIEDLCDEHALRTKLERVLPEKNALLAVLGAEARFDVQPLVDQALRWGERLAPYMADGTWLVQDALARGDHVLLEGAQGTLLDLDHGSYPYVTSSSPIAGGACTGGGIGPLQVDEVFGVMKAYATRVGAGPFPTELLDEIGAGIAQRGHEVGTTTGRPRRVGWFDAVPARFAVGVNSASSIMLNKLDILSGIDPVRLCVAYELDGRRIDAWPSSAEVLTRATPIYEDFEGWDQPIHDVRALGDLPEPARRYVTALEEHAGAPIVLVSVGPERTQTIERAWRPMRRACGGDARVTLHQPTRILVVGGGGREHALAWKLADEPGVNEVIVAPGSDGIAQLPRVRTKTVDTLDGAAVVALARAEAAELVVIGPEAPLAAGVADALGDAGIAVFGPTRAAARIETLQGVLPRGRRRRRRPDGAGDRRHDAGRCRGGDPPARAAGQRVRREGRWAGRGQGRHGLRARPST